MAVIAALAVVTACIIGGTVAGLCLAELILR
jgi:hypothetical protein